MKKLPLFLRLGFAIMGIDPYAKPQEPVTTKVNSQEDPQPTGQQVNSQEQRIPTPTSQSAWTPIEISKPDKFKKVVIFTNDKEILYDWARVNNTDFIHSKDDRTINNVTHWMNIESPTVTPETTNTTIKPKGPKLPV
jgi:hypothetical protein